MNSLLSNSSHFKCFSLVFLLKLMCLVWVAAACFRGTRICNNFNGLSKISTNYCFDCVMRRYSSSYPVKNIRRSILHRSKSAGKFCVCGLQYRVFSIFIMHKKKKNNAYPNVLYIRMPINEINDISLREHVDGLCRWLCAVNAIVEESDRCKVVITFF